MSTSDMNDVTAGNCSSGTVIQSTFGSQSTNFRSSTQKDAGTTRTFYLKESVQFLQTQTLFWHRPPLFPRYKQWAAQAESLTAVPANSKLKRSHVALLSRTRTSGIILKSTFSKIGARQPSPRISYPSLRPLPASKLRRRRRWPEKRRAPSSCLLRSRLRCLALWSSSEVFIGVGLSRNSRSDAGNNFVIRRSREGQAPLLSLAVVFGLRSAVNV